MKRNFRNVLCFVLAIIFVFTSFNCVTFASDERDSEVEIPVLKFDKNGKFKTMQVTDMHTTDQPYEEVADFLGKAIDKYKPDLVMYTGDIVNGGWFLSTPISVKKAIDFAVKPVAQRNIPFAFAFGNHDQETYCPKTYQIHCYRSYEQCVIPFKFSYIKGLGDYNLTVKNSTGEKDIFNIWVFDSGTRTGFSGSDIKPVTKGQINKYIEKSNELREANGGIPLPSIVFQHVPVQEVYTELFTEVPEGTENSFAGTFAFEGKYFVPNPERIIEGAVYKSIGGGTKNNGEYDAFVSQGDVIGMFFGHDHQNDYFGKTDDNIYMGGTRAIGFQSRSNERGLRLITIDEKNTGELETETVLYSDIMDTEPPVEHKEYDNVERLKAIPKYLAELFK